MRRVLLLLVYLAVVTPIGMVRRILGKAITRGPDPRMPTYWTFPAPEPDACEHIVPSNS